MDEQESYPGQGEELREQWRKLPYEARKAAPPFCRWFMRMPLHSVPGIELCVDCKGFYRTKTGRPVSKTTVRILEELRCPF